MEVFCKKKSIYKVDAAETRFGRVLHSVKTIIFENFQIINHLKFYPLQKRLIQCHIWGLSEYFESSSFPDSKNVRNLSMLEVLERLLRTRF